MYSLKILMVVKYAGMIMTSTQAHSVETSMLGGEGIQRRWWWWWVSTQNDRYGGWFDLSERCEVFCASIVELRHMPFLGGQLGAFI